MTRVHHLTDVHNRTWQITILPNFSKHETDVKFFCVKNGRTRLHQQGKWTPKGWDMQTWYPRVPAPVPQEVYDFVIRQLREMDGQV